MFGDVFRVIKKFFGFGQDSECHNENTNQESRVEVEVNMSNSEVHNKGDAYKHNNVGPVIFTSDIADAVVEAAEIDNPDRIVEVERRASYVRIKVPEECILNAATIEKALGRPFKMHELESVMSAFSGQVDTQSEQIRFYMERTL